MAAALNDANITDLLGFVRKAITALRAEHPADARALGELVQRLLPILYDHTAVDAVRDQVDDPAAVLVGLPIATAFVAEAVMAGADGRETRWQPPYPGRELEGQLRLPLPGQAEYLDLVRAVLALAGDDRAAQRAMLKRIAAFALKKHPDALAESAEDGDISDGARR